jgi:hypothetical protein
MRSACLISLLLLAAAPAADAQSRGGRRGWRTGDRGAGWTYRARVGGTSRVQRGGVPSSRSTPRRSYSTPRRASRRIGSYPSYPTYRSNRSRRANRSRRSRRGGVTIRTGRGGPRVTYSRPRRRQPVCPTPTTRYRAPRYQPPRVAVRTRVPGGSLTFQRGRNRSSVEYCGPDVRYRQRWSAPDRVVYVDRPVVVERPVVVDRPTVVRRPVVIESPAPNASGAPAPLSPVIVGRRRRSRSAPPAPRVESAPARANWRTARPRADQDAPRAVSSTTRPGVADRLLSRLQSEDLVAACEVATWAKDDPRREEILRKALFARFPSPSLLRDSAQRLRDDAACRDHPGRPTLARLLGTNSAPR